MYRVTGVIRLKPKTPDGKREQMQVRQTVIAADCGMAFSLVRQAYQDRLEESDLTAEEVGRD